MNIFKTKKELQEYLSSSQQREKKVALIPTMGALHEGHISLIEYAKPLADILVCSIFVNPTQFNDPQDLEKYPRPIESDIKLLEAASCDILFMPSVAEMYTPQEQWHVDLGELDRIWEGAHRPGHFQGVTQIVYKLFTLVQPDIACFGQKDFQQVMVINRMIQEKKLDIELVICPIVRDEHGLALSSRNARLSSQGKLTALALSRSLEYVRSHFENKPLETLKEDAQNILESTEGVELEYFTICETTSLSEATEIEVGKKYVALVTAWVEGVRLIDNMILN